MKKIDLHIHTQSTITDSCSFILDMEYLKSYVHELNLDAIAITNHNIFDLHEFNEITNNLEIVVFPGVEVDLEKGHILVIAPIECINSFNEQVKKLTELIVDQNSFITYEQFKKIFSNYSDYLLIPHIDTKHKAMKESVIEKFGADIVAGEVMNFKRFLTRRKQDVDLNEVVFSDHRMVPQHDSSGKTLPFPTKYTYLSIEDITIPSIKMALSDPKNISINETKSDELIPINSEGTLASSKLNLVVGQRSTGKTYTLKQISRSFRGAENDNSVKYIEQFQIVNESKDESFEIIKNEISNQLSNNLNNKITKVIEEVIDLDLDQSNVNLDDYVTTLIEFANLQSQSDAYSQTKLFKEVIFSIVHPEKLKNLIESTICVHKETIHQDIVEKYISRDKLRNLILELIKSYRVKMKEIKLKEISNELVSKVKIKLSNESAIQPAKEVSFINEFKIHKKINLFNSLQKDLSRTTEINTLEMFRFTVKLIRQPYANAQDLNRTFKTTGLKPCLDIFENGDLFRFIQCLEAKGIDRRILFKGLYKTRVSITNQKGVEISHGERAEFNLLRHIENSKYYDVLLLDEPEASFDNIFIKEYIIERLKDISQNTTVFVSTHNNTLGSSLKPDYIIFTDIQSEMKTTGDFINNFEVYSGSFTSKELMTPSGKAIANYKVHMNTMEAGEEAYLERKKVYENIKDL